jgi:AcrR family transcriptional regulator
MAKAQLAKTHLPKAQPKANLWEHRKRECIQDAVIQLMSREGLAAVTMDRVAQEVGLAKGTLYLHYRDKQHLLDAAKEAALEPMMERVQEVLDSTLPPVEKLEAFALRYVSYFDERREFFRVLLQERETTHGTRLRSDRYRRLLTALTAIIELAIKGKIFRSMDAAKSAAIFLESNIAIIHHRLLANDRTPVESDVKLICRLFEHGALTPAAERRSA